MRTRPDNYGQWWNTNDKGVEWYESIHNDLPYIHTTFDTWAQKIEGSFFEIGCGRSYYAKYLEHYTGCDISKKEIEWCKDQYPQLDFVCGDFIELASTLLKYDVVFSHSVLDHIYDIDLFIEASWSIAHKWIYHSTYSGWFPDLKDHEYRWSESDTCFYNKIASQRIIELLQRMGALEIDIKPIETIGRRSAPHHMVSYDTLIIARKS